MPTRTMDRRCPDCGASLLTNLRSVWCSNVGPPACVYGLRARVPFVFETCADGWPRCPYCGEDELYSLLHWDGTADTPPPVAAFIAAGLRCYACQVDVTPPIAAIPSEGAN